MRNHHVFSLYQMLDEALSIYRSHSMTSAETGTMRESVCPSNANLRGDLEAGYLVPCLESTRTFPTIFFRSEPMPTRAEMFANWPERS